jgi:hypothetical protein
LDATRITSARVASTHVRVNKNADRYQLIFGEDGVACRIEMPLAANAS